MIGGRSSAWSIADAAELYEVPRWGHGYFSVADNGRLFVHPERKPESFIDLKRLVDDLQVRGVDLPVLIRFEGILKHRLQEIHDVFANAITEHDYDGRYSCIYPIKVNQQRQVVEQVWEYGRQFGFGLEAGSKPELLVVMALADNQTPIICNGFKDAAYIEAVMLAQKLGRKIIPVVEKYSELELILRLAEETGVRPQIGMRVKLAAMGSGRWQESGGFRSKFGLTLSEIIMGLAELERRDMADCFKLLHFHMGSQVTNIRHLKTALVEGARVYVDLVRRGAGLEFLDVGGGLGVDYDGSRTDFESSVNYTLQEYANDVIYQIRVVCDDADVAHPHVFSESGRAIAAFHSVLVFGVLGVVVQGQGATHEELPDEVQQPLEDLRYTYRNLTGRNVLESFHDAQQLRDLATNLFATGHLSLSDRSTADDLFWAICRRIRKLVEELDYVPEELESLDRLLADIYFCNFSLFQSMPDSWAIKQLFPVMPIHRLGERPTRDAVLADITCDSDGKIDQFIDRRAVKRTLKLHAQDDSPYYLAAFLVGAYQEVLGDLHNLFGDTNAVHVNLSDQDDVVLETIVKGDRVDQVIGYMQYQSSELLQRLQTSLEEAVRESRLDHKSAGRLASFYEAGLRGYTYLEEPDGE